MKVPELAEMIGVTHQMLHRWNAAGYLHPETLINSDGKARVYGSGDIETAARMARLVKAGMPHGVAYRLVCGEPHLTGVLIAELDGVSREPILEPTSPDEPAAECAVVDAMDLCVAVRDLDPRDLWRELQALLVGEPWRLMCAVVALAAMVPADRPVRELLAWTESLHNEQEVA